MAVSSMNYRDQPSIINSALESMEGTSGEEPAEITLIIVGDQCKNDVQLTDAVKKLQHRVNYSIDGQNYLNTNDEGCEYFFVYHDFTDEIYTNLTKAEARVVGPPVIIQCANTGEALPFSPRPLYCMMMRHLVICFSGIREKTELSHLADLVHHMGGGIRKNFTSSVTHLVSLTTSGDKYRSAVSFGAAMMATEWVVKCWERRDEVGLAAKHQQFDEYRLKPFFLCRLAFYGFPPEEKTHMQEMTTENGGEYVTEETVGADYTHLVVEDSKVKQIPFELSQQACVVKAEWFWCSIQMNACATESLYAFFSTGASPCVLRSASSASRGRRYKRLRNNLHKLAQEGEVDSPFCSSKRRQSAEVSRLSLSASQLDVSLDGSVEGVASPGESQPPTPKEAPKVSVRQYVVTELLQTEKNYTQVLHNILTIISQIFKASIENPNQPGGPLLPSKDMELIFGGLPPIYHLHVAMRDQLADLVANWKEERSVGQIILDHHKDMEKAYPPFVNYFEKTKETIMRCDRTMPRFHAFLKRCLSRPECGREALDQLMIRPVQRLPSVILLLTDMLKRTNKNNPDYAMLEKAIAALKDVMTHINEDKRKTEGRMAMFDIVNDIENCPPTLLSSHRTFINRVNVLELCDELSGRGDILSLFLFSDHLEICKRKAKVASTQPYRSPVSSRSNPHRQYKHVELLSLPAIKRVVDCSEDTEECQGVFALVCRPGTSLKEKLYSFSIVTEDVNKDEYLTSLSKQIAVATCRTDRENLLVSMAARTLEIDVSDLATRSLSTKAKRFASRTRKRVSRAFSFNQSPRKLKRTTSTLLDNNGSPYDSSTMITPRRTPRASLLGSGRMAASTLNLEDFAMSPIDMIVEEESSDVSMNKNASVARTASLRLQPSRNKFTS